MQELFLSEILTSIFTQSRDCNSETQFTLHELAGKINGSLEAKKVATYILLKLGILYRDILYLIYTNKMYLLAFL
jgi:hypothetical protein